MSNYPSGAVILVALPFTNTLTAKLRTALVLIDTKDQDIIVARITSQVTHKTFTVEIEELEQANLLKLSWVRVDKINTIEKSLVNRQLGTLASQDWEKVKDQINLLWAKM